MYAAIEAGGTKFVCAIGNARGQVLRRITIPTRTPRETMSEVFAFFDAQNFEAMGIGSFGPVDVDPDSETYGWITSTPKPGWRNYNFLSAVRRRYGVPVGWTSDVNASCLGEYACGAGRDTDCCLYLTIGTGIGGGVIQNGTFLGGRLTPEMGHIRIRRHPQDNYPGGCPYHGDCLEGLVAGPTILARTGVNGAELPEEHPVWVFLSDYIAQALVNYTLILRPDRIILGGGVMHQPRMLPLIRETFLHLLNDYISTPDETSYLVLPALGDDSGIVGALLLAQRALEKANDATAKSVK